MVNGSDCLQIWGRAGLQLIKSRIQEYVVSCGMITHHFKKGKKFSPGVGFLSNFFAQGCIFAKSSHKGAGI